MKSDIEHPIWLAIRWFGSQRALADKLEVHPSMISQIASDRRKMPISMCRDIELLSDGGITREQLRPDIFGDPSQAA